MIDAEMRLLERQAATGDVRARRKLDAIKARLEPDRLGSDQERALEAVAQGRNVFLTGAPGTGKSTVIASLRRRFSDKVIAITAATGLAALRVGGSTLHRFSRVMPDDVDNVMKQEPKTPQDWERVMRAQARIAFYRAESMEQDRFAERMRRVDLLVLDEVSMIDAVTFELAMRTIDLARGERALDYDESTGAWTREGFVRHPIQVLLSGDFAQLLPISGRTHGLAFEAPSWTSLAPVLIELSESYRSSKDERLTAMLVGLRDGIVTDRTAEILKAQHGVFDPDGDGVVRLVSKRDEAREINDRKIRALPGVERILKSIDIGDRKLLADCLSPDVLVLKVGAKVMLTQNGFDAHGASFVNGMVGIVERMDGSGVLVRVPEVDDAFLISERGTWTIWGNESLGERIALAERRQYPLTLAWALTLHKAQGCTFDKVSCDLSSAWEFGHVYVALSRARKLVDLNIESMPNQEIDMDKRILPWLHEVR